MAMNHIPQLVDALECGELPQELTGLLSRTDLRTGRSGPRRHLAQQLQVQIPLENHSMSNSVYIYESVTWQNTRRMGDTDPGVTATLSLREIPWQKR